MKLYKLNKTVLSLKNNPAQFLNGLTSNTLDRTQNAFLNIHGRVVATFDQAKINEDEYWIVVESPFVDVLLKHVEKYVRLGNVQLKKLSKQIYFDLQEDANAITEGQKVLPQKRGRLIISDEELDVNVSEDVFTLFRVKHLIPVQGIDYSDEFILNIGEQDFVSFTKGCFLGQEPVSKVHNRSSPTWQLVVKYEDECDEESREKMTSKILNPENNRIIGFVFVKNT